MRKILLLILFTTGILAADTISTTASCAVAGRSPLYGTTSCLETDSYGTSARAQSSATELIGGNEVYADFTQAEFVSYAHSTEPMPNSDSAMASGSVNLELSTPGPVRDGYLELYVTQSFTDQYEGRGGLSVQVGSYSASCSIVDFFDCEGILPSQSSAAANPIPFTLGETFRFSASVGSSAFCTPIDGECFFNFGTESDVPIYARFFENDGVTPVAVSDPVVPEPASAWMGLVALALILCVKVKASVVQPK